MVHRGLTIRLAWLPLVSGPWLGLVPSDGAASDGRIEINHERAVAGGVTTDDAAGYPVTLTRPGSYVLTGNLTPPDKTTAIVIESDEVELDLRGHAIRGSFSCSPGACVPLSGVGIDTSRTEGALATVRDGFVEGFGTDCVRLASGARVVGLVVGNCGEDGIEVGDGSVVRESTVRRVGRHGLHFSGGTGRFGDDVIADTASDVASGESVSGGSAQGGSLCEDGDCSRRGTRRFYLTAALFLGDAVLTACVPGFHVASAVELVPLGALEYAPGPGLTAADSGLGPPPEASGWARTGLASHANRNCSDWTSSAFTDVGTRMLLATVDLWGVAVSHLGPFVAFFDRECSDSQRVWCIED
jgi:hypothetical protein